MADYIEREKVLLKAAPVAGCFSDMISVYDVIMLPAADVAPVVHARWIAVDEYMTDECSNCGARINIEEFYDCSYHPKYGNVRLDYCPNCGATMDLEV